MVVGTFVCIDVLKYTDEVADAYLLGLIMIIISLRFSRKNDYKWSSFFAKKLHDYRDNHYFAKNKKLAIIAIIAKRKAIIAISRSL
jgi:hypothetical protein